MIQVESIIDVIPELSILSKKHHEEIYPFDVKFDPDWERYKQLDHAGVIHMVTARHEETLIGYNINIVMRDMHHKNDLFSINDSIYLHPRARGTGLGSEMITFTDKYLKKLGVKLAHISVKKDHDFSSLLTRIGYIEHEAVYVKELI